MPEGAAVAITASIAGGQWATHLTEISELIAVEGWDESLAWIDAHPELFEDAYSVSKEFMQVYTMMSSKDAQQRGHRINSVCPSPIDTPLLPDFRETMSEKTIDWCIEQSGRVAQPRDIALVLAFLGMRRVGVRERREPQRRPRLHRRHDDGPARLRRVDGLMREMTDALAARRREDGPHARVVGRRVFDALHRGGRSEAPDRSAGGDRRRHRRRRNAGLRGERLPVSAHDHGRVARRRRRFRDRHLPPILVRTESPVDPRPAHRAGCDPPRAQPALAREVWRASAPAPCSARHYPTDCDAPATKTRGQPSP